LPRLRRGRGTTAFKSFIAAPYVRYF
jgi:hypothetical protein